MLNPDLIKKAIDLATREVFGTMLDIPLADENLGGQPAEGGVVALVGLTGNWSGTGTISCSAATASHIATKLLLLDDDGTARPIDEDVLDAVAELTNMIVGNIKNILEDSLGTMAISIPTVVYGRNFRFKSFAGLTDCKSVFTWEQHSFKVQVSLAPTFEHASTVRQRLMAPAFSAE